MIILIVMIIIIIVMIIPPLIHRTRSLKSLQPTMETDARTFHYLCVRSSWESNRVINR